METTRSTDIMASCSTSSLNCNSQGISKSNETEHSPDLNLSDFLQMVDKSSEAANELQATCNQLEALMPNIEHPMPNEQNIFLKSGGDSLFNFSTTNETGHGNDVSGDRRVEQPVHIVPRIGHSALNLHPYSMCMPHTVGLRNNLTKLPLMQPVRYQNDNYVVESFPSIDHSHMSQINKPRKTVSRMRLGRRRNPLKHFQPEIFMRPYSKREQSPQLQLVKLVRQKSQENRQDDPAEVLMSQMQAEQEQEITNIDNPELAFMKTVDMPSGQRVEDIYVVPSVWISNENSDPSNLVAIQPTSPELNIPTTVCMQLSKDNSLGSPMDHLDLANYPQEDSLSQGIHIDTPPLDEPSTSISHHYGVSKETSFASLSLDSHVTTKHDIITGKSQIGHIITTLNVPKLGNIPSLKELCKAVLDTQADKAGYALSSENFYLQRLKTSISFMTRTENIINSDLENRLLSPKHFLDMNVDSVNEKPDDSFVPFDNDAKEHGLEVNSLRNNHMAISPSGVNSRSSLYSNTFASKDDCSPSERSDFYGEKFLSESPLGSENHEVRKNSGSQQTKGFEMRQNQEIDSLKEQSDNKGVANNNCFTRNTSMYNSSLTNREPVHISSCKFVMPVTSHGSVQGHHVLRFPAVQVGKPGHSVNSSRSEGFVNRVQCKFSSQPDQFNCPLKASQEVSGQVPRSDKAPVASLASVLRQIKSLSSFEPLNRPLANLASALQLLSDAERTLWSTNSATYLQVKLEQDSKLGRLNTCILKLGDSIGTIGHTLQEWTKDPGNSCFRTMGVLTELYNSNIMMMLELIMPYFNYICELISNSQQNTANAAQQHQEAGSSQNFGASSKGKAGCGQAGLYMKTSSSSTYSFPCAGKTRTSTSHNILQNCILSYPTTVQDRDHRSVKCISGTKRSQQVDQTLGKKRQKVNLMKKVLLSQPTDSKPRPVWPNKVYQHYGGSLEGRTLGVLPNKILVNMSSSGTDSDHSANHGTVPRVPSETLYPLKDCTNLPQGSSSGVTWFVPSSRVAGPGTSSVGYQDDTNLTFRKDDGIVPASRANIIMTLSKDGNLIHMSNMTNTEHLMDHGQHGLPYSYPSVGQDPQKIDANNDSGQSTKRLIHQPNTSSDSCSTSAYQSLSSQGQQLLNSSICSQQLGTFHDMGLSHDATGLGRGHNSGIGTIGLGHNMSTRLGSGIHRGIMGTENNLTQHFQTSLAVSGFGYHNEKKGRMAGTMSDLEDTDDEDEEEDEEDEEEEEEEEDCFW